MLGLSAFHIGLIVFCLGIGLLVWLLLRIDSALHHVRAELNEIQRLIRQESNR